MSLHTLPKKMILNAVPVAWMHKLTPGSPATIAETYIFDNLGEIKLTLANPAASTTTTDKVEIKRADGAILSTPKFNLELNIEDETDVTSTTASSDASGKGTITMTINEAPKPNTIKSWTAFLESLRANFDSVFLVTIPLGFSFESRNLATPKADGYAYMLAKINSNIENTFGENPTSLSIELVSYKGSAVAGLTDAILAGATLTYTAAAWKGKGFTFTPPDVDSTGGTKLFAGDILILEDAGSSYTFTA